VLCHIIECPIQYTNVSFFKIVDQETVQNATLITRSVTHVILVTSLSTICVHVSYTSTFSRNDYYNKTVYRIVGIMLYKKRVKLG